jgi:hypothetical protein
MITIRLVSSLLFGQHNENCLPGISFKAKLSVTKEEIVDTFCSNHRGLRPDKVNLRYVLDKETRATQMVRCFS